jgi:hypothetical protein
MSVSLDSGLKIIQVSKTLNCIKKQVLDWALVAHTCNLTYSRGRDQEVPSSRPNSAKSKTPFQNTQHTQKSAGGVAQMVEHLLARVRP